MVEASSDWKVRGRACRNSMPVGAGRHIQKRTGGLAWTTLIDVPSVCGQGRRWPPLPHTHTHTHTHIGTHRRCFAHHFLQVAARPAQPPQEARVRRHDERHHQRGRQAALLPVFGGAAQREGGVEGHGHQDKACAGADRRTTHTSHARAGLWKQEARDPIMAPGSHTRTHTHVCARARTHTHTHSHTQTHIHIYTHTRYTHAWFLSLGL
jgi:hypothetical protein